MTRLARLFDLALPGIGTLLSGRFGAGISALGAWFVTVAGLALAVGYRDLNPIRAVLVAGVTYLWLSVLLFSARIRAGARPRPVAAIAGVVAFVVGIACCLSHLSLVTIKGFSMFPALLPGEVVVVRHDESPPSRGELMAARVGDRVIIARVVGLPGDRIQMAGPSLTINDSVVPSNALGMLRFSERLTPELEARMLEAYEEALGNTKHIFFFKRDVTISPATYDVPNDCVFLLADNRSTADALDSREFGSVRISDLLGRPGQVVWSRDQGIRFDRIGYIWH